MNIVGITFFAICTVIMLYGFYKSTKRKAIMKKRHSKLGEKITSNLFERKHKTEFLLEINGQLNQEEIKSIYWIGICKASENVKSHLIKLIKDTRFNSVYKLNETIEEGDDEFGPISIGEYIEIYVFESMNSKQFVQLVQGSFEKNHNQVLMNIDIPYVDITTIIHRKLIFPI